MTALAAITLGDRTPTNVVFNPSAIDPQGVAKFFETAAASIDERRGLTLSVKLPKVGGQVARVTAKVVIPVMDSVNTTLKVGESICNMEFVFSKRATLNQRKDMLAFAKNYLANAAITAAVENLEAVY